jgi:hypothetical protein
MAEKNIETICIRRSLPAGLTGLALLAFSLSSSEAHACAFDMVKPERTQIDRMVESERLVLARPAHANPYKFEISTSLIGAQESGAS